MSRVNVSLGMAQKVTEPKGHALDRSGERNNFAEKLTREKLMYKIFRQKGMGLKI